MKPFAAMYDAIDRTTSTNGKIAAMVSYFREAPAGDAAWALFFLTGRRLKRLLKLRDLWEWTIERTGLAPWLMEESYAVVGDFAEAMALLMDRDDLAEVEARAPAQESLWSEPPEEDAGGAPAPQSLAVWVERLLLLPTWDREQQRAAVFRWWAELDRTERFLLNKLMTGEWRVGVSQRLVVRAVSAASGVDESTVAQRLAGEWWPSEAWYRELVRPGVARGSVSAGGAPAPRVSESGRPYPFFLASPLEEEPESLGEIGEWLAEYKWDGIRAQLLRRGGRVWLWSRGDELITDRFPEIRDAAVRLPDGTVLDGEVLAWREGVLPFSILQRRIGRLGLTPGILADAPAAFVAFDLLDREGTDWRERSLSERRAGLEELLLGRGGGKLVVSPRLEASSWGDIAEARRLSRERLVEGIMLKRLSSAYQIGRKRGDWWKWKIEPLAVDAVLVYAQPGHGRRANLLTDLTFAVWDGEPASGGELVPVAKAYSGLDGAEIAELDRWIRSHTVERFGPARAVEPVQVFELHFEGVRESTRHRSGVAVRFPRIARWRRDKGAADADTLERVREMLRAQEKRAYHRGAETQREKLREEEDGHG